VYILLLLDTGMRASELCGLDFSHIDTHNRRVRVMGKGAKLDKVFLLHFCFSNLAEFPIIPISGRDCAAAARTGGRIPKAARVKPTRL